MESPTDAELVLACRAGDRAAWAALVDRHGPAMLAALKDYLRGAAEAEDVFQEAWARLMEDGARRLGTFDPARALAPWLVAVALNQARRRLSSAKSSLPMEAAFGLPAGGTGPSEGLESAEALVEVRDALATLSPRERLLLEMCEVEGVPQAKVAALLGVGEPSVAPLLARARKRLKGRLENRNSPDRSAGAGG